MLSKKASTIHLMLLFIFVLFLAFAGLGQTTLATPMGEELQTAPLNPAFVAYMERLEEGDVGVLTKEGYRAGVIPSPMDTSHIWELPADDYSVLSLPDEFDLRDTGRLTDVRNQNPYGSCWAFATYSSLESHLLPEDEYNFSENNLMYQHGFDWSPNDGGNHFMSTAYLARWSGPVLEQDDPYDSSPTTGLSPVKHVQKVEFIPAERDLIKQKVYEDGALYTTMYWEDDPYGSGSGMFQDSNLQSSYYNGSTYAYYYSGDKDVNHGVAIVGWDDHFDRTNFNDYPPDDGAWIVRNSWGENWGDGGYFYLSYYDQHAGRNATAFHNAEPTTNYGRVYQYDWLGYVTNIGYGGETAYGANIFTAEADESLVAVSTYAVAHNMSYEIDIYTGVTEANPTSGDLKHTQSGSIINAGYYTIPLSSPVSITEGQGFSVVIKFTTPDYNWPIAVEYPYDNFSSGVTANPGEGFVSGDGSSWQDLGEVWSASICIKAFTEDDEPELSSDADLSALSIVSGTLEPTFSPEIEDYSVSVAYNVSSIEVTANLSDENASLTIEDVAATSGEAVTVDLFDPGHSTVIKIEVTAEDGATTKTYTITVNRAESPLEPTWRSLTTADAQALAYDGGVLAASVEGFGIGLYDGNDWVNLTSATALALATDGSTLVASVEGFGIWAYDGSWSQLTPFTADLIAVDNGMIAASFADHGIWLFDGNAWANLTPAPARALAFDSGRLVASVDGFGTWLNVAGEWQQLTEETAQHLTISGSNIAASFAGFGIWFNDSNAWHNLVLLPARALALDNGILAASVDGFGTWLNDGEWNNILAARADLLALDSGKVAASFEGQGIWLYE